MGTQAPLFEVESPLVQRALGSCEFRKKIWDADPAKRNQADDLLGSGEALASLFNCLFWSSLQVEEGRPAFGTVCICSPSEAPRSRKLACPVPVTTESLIQLFVASPSNSLAVDLRDGKPSIWGFLDARPMFVLSAKVAGVGTLVLSEDSEVVGVLQAGKLALPKSLHSTGWALLLARALGTASFATRAMLAARIQAVAFSMHAQRHGGALVIVPPVVSGEHIPDISFKFRFDPDAENCIRSAIDELTAASTNLTNVRGEWGQSTAPAEFHSLLTLSVKAHQNMLDAVCKSVGRLSRIDGALVMDTNLKVYGFGAKLGGVQGDFPVLSCDALTGSFEEATLASLGGMRHQSAARYVQGNPESMIVVASQDGRLTLFAWVLDDGRVVAIRGLEHYTWNGVVW